MKLKNLFKKSGTKNTKATVAKIDKTQLSKIVGGVDSDRISGGGKGHVVGNAGNGLV